MTPDADDLWFLPLGGCGEIGMNLNLYGHDGRWLMVDCGVTFADPAAGARVQMADPQFIAARRESLTGLVLTHAHEDHIGAVPYLWPRLRCPVYATPFTAEVLRRKLREFRLENRVPLRTIDCGARFSIGPFDLEWVALTHSIPEPQALLIRTAAGRVFHTADWKLDATPVLGKPFNPGRYQALAEENLDAMVCDSTNATVSGRSASEAALYDGLLAAVAAASGRVVVGCFASNVARLLTLARVAAAAGRSIGLLGRSLDNMLAAAKATGVWRATPALIDPEHLGYLPRDKVLAVATGSQGEPRGALSRLAADGHPLLALDVGDTVLFSARVIPGNEAAVGSLVTRFRAAGVTVIEAREAALPLHASGHPAADELALMYGWVRPQLAIPVHGEPPHLRANARIAKASGVPRQLVGGNGDLFYIAPAKGVRRRAVAAGRLGLHGDTLGALA